VASTTPARQRVRLFLAAHVLAVVCIYGIALAVGGGFGSTPFTPELMAGRATASSATAQTAQTALTEQTEQTAAADAPRPTARSLAATPIPAADVPPPWMTDAQGRVSLRAD